MCTPLVRPSCATAETIRGMAAHAKGVEFQPWECVPRMPLDVCARSADPSVPDRYQAHPLGANEVEIKVTHCGVCHSDIHTGARVRARSRAGAVS